MRTAVHRELLAHIIAFQVQESSGLALNILLFFFLFTLLACVGRPGEEQICRLEGMQLSEVAIAAIIRLFEMLQFDLLLLLLLLAYFIFLLLS